MPLTAKACIEHHWCGSIITIKVPVVYMVRDTMILMWATHFKGHWKGTGTKFLISKFLITKFLITKFLITKFLSNKVPK
jgi:hypothetical protein